MKTFALSAVLAVLAGSAYADGHTSPQGDAAAGEEQFNRQCTSCHVVRDANGDVLAGRSARTGPNLFGLAGRGIGTMEDYPQYSDPMTAMGENGAVWTEEAFVGYVQDPTAWLREQLDDRRARGRMAYQVRQEQQAYDIFAFLATMGPAQ